MQTQATVLIASALTIMGFLDCPGSEAAPAEFSEVKDAHSSTTTAAVLFFDSDSKNPANEPSRIALHDLLIAEIKKAGGIRILPDASIKYALQQTAYTNKNLSGEAVAHKLGEIIDAEKVVWGALARKGQKWLAYVRVLDRAKNGTSVELTISSTNLCEIADHVSSRLLQDLKPSLQLPTLQRTWSCSDGALERYGKGDYIGAINFDPQFAQAYAALAAVRSNEGKWAEAEGMAQKALELDPNNARAHAVKGAALWASAKSQQSEDELQTALRLDPDDSSTWMHLAHQYYVQHRWPEALQAYRTAFRLDPYASYASYAHAQAGTLLIQLRNEAAALTELDQSSLTTSSSDLDTEQTLAKAYWNLGRLPQAFQHAQRYITLAKPLNPQPAELQAFEKFVSEFEPKLKPAYFTNVPPEDYSEEALKKAIRRILGTAELSAAQNPLATSPGICRRAHEIADAGTNDLQKAELLFSALIPRVKNDAPLPDQFSRTAAGTLEILQNPNAVLHCQDASFLLIALARAVGLKAYVTQIEVTCGSVKTPHVCAAIYIDGKAALVDPSYYWFGAPHKRFSVLDDLQAIGVYLCPSTDLRQNQVAAKLAPRIPLVQYNLCRTLIDLDNWDEVRKVLPLLEEIDTNGALAACVKGALALHDGSSELAVSYLRKAVEIDPHNFYGHAQLGNIYAAQGNARGARDAYERALLCPHTKKDADAIQQSIEQLPANGARIRKTRSRR